MTRYPVPYPDIIEAVVALIDRSVEILSVATSSNTHVLAVCDVKYAQGWLGFKVTINAIEYTIVEVDEEALTITVTGATAPPATTFDLYPVLFFQGTPIQTDDDLSKIQVANEKTPMVWLLETYVERTDDDELSSIDRVITSRLFFLTQSDHDLWSRETITVRSVKPMRRLEVLFKQALRDSALVSMDKYSHESEPHTRFGVYISNRGKEQSLFADRLSGMEHRSEPRLWRGRPCPSCE